jgi:CubicO group peptidase (beta-lactamase class C family)
MHRRDLLALIAGTLLEPGTRARAAADRTSLKDVDRAIEHALAATHSPGVAVAMVRGDRTLLAKGYGYADVDAGRRAGADTAFYVASVAKVVTATVLMLLWEEKAFALDDPVAPRLDFPLSHPRFPDVPITFRQLLTHTSGISDQQWYSLTPSASPPLLRDFLISYLTPSGKLYDPQRCFGAMPGKTWSYCSVAYALLGYLVGLVGPDPLDSVSNRRLFGPLGMTDTAWRYEGLKKQKIAECYEFKNGHFKQLPRPSYPDWPDGLLVTSAADFAKLLGVFTQGGGSILKPGTVSSMLVPDTVTVDEHDPFVRQALMWDLHSNQGVSLATKYGNDAGATSFVALDPVRHTAILVFANITSNPEINALFQGELAQLLLAKASQI